MPPGARSLTQGEGAEGVRGGRGIDAGTRARVGLGLSLLPALWLLVFFVIPFGVLVAWSFQPPGIRTYLMPRWTVDAYVLTLSVTSYWSLLGKTVLLALGSRRSRWLSATPSRTRSRCSRADDATCSWASCSSIAHELPAQDLRVAVAPGPARRAECSPAVGRGR